MSFLGGISKTVSKAAKTKAPPKPTTRVPVPYAPTPKGAKAAKAAGYPTGTPAAQARAVAPSPARDLRRAALKSQHQETHRQLKAMRSEMRDFHQQVLGLDVAPRSVLSAPPSTLTKIPTVHNKPLYRVLSKKDPKHDWLPTGVPTKQLSPKQADRNTAVTAKRVFKKSGLPGKPPKILHDNPHSAAPGGGQVLAYVKHGENAVHVTNQLQDSLAASPVERRKAKQVLLHEDAHTRQRLPAQRQRVIEGGAEAFAARKAKQFWGLASPPPNPFYRHATRKIRGRGPRYIDAGQFKGPRPVTRVQARRMRDVAPGKKKRGKAGLVALGLGAFAAAHAGDIKRAMKATDPHKRVDHFGKTPTLGKPHLGEILRHPQKNKVIGGRLVTPKMGKVATKLAKAEAKRLPTGGGLTKDQAVFSKELAKLSGLNTKVVASWVLGENGAADSPGYHNYLGVAASSRDHATVFAHPKSAARETYKTLKTGGASIPEILTTAGKSPQKQFQKISHVGWDLGTVGPKPDYLNLIEGHFGQIKGGKKSSAIKAAEVKAAKVGITPKDLAAGPVGPAAKATIPGTKLYAFPVPHGFTHSRTDMGKDWGNAVQGSPILAIGSGKIVKTGGAGWPEGGGVVLQLDHPPDPSHKYVYYYEGLSPVVTVGDRVKKGQAVAKSAGSSIELGWSDAAGTPLSHDVYQEGEHTSEGASFSKFMAALKQGKTRISADLLHVGGGTTAPSSGGTSSGGTVAVPAAAQGAAGAARVQKLTRQGLTPQQIFSKLSRLGVKTGATSSSTTKVTGLAELERRYGTGV